MEAGTLRPVGLTNDSDWQCEIYQYRYRGGGMKHNTGFAVRITLKSCQGKILTLLPGPLSNMQEGAGAWQWKSVQGADILCGSLDIQLYIPQLLFRQRPFLEKEKSCYAEPFIWSSTSTCKVQNHEFARCSTEKGVIQAACTHKLFVSPHAFLTVWD